jgi:hypothetical protein
MAVKGDWGLKKIFRTCRRGNVDSACEEAAFPGKQNKGTRRNAKLTSGAG